LTGEAAAGALADAVDATVAAGVGAVVGVGATAGDASGDVAGPAHAPTRMAADSRDTTRGMPAMMPHDRASVRVPLARVWSQASGGTIHRTLGWGDRVEYIKREGPNLVVDTLSFEEKPDGSVLPIAVRGYIRHDGKPMPSILAGPDHDVLAVDFVDVQQGDAAVVESPAGAVMLIDGGENQLFARYLANRFAGSTAAAPREIDTIVVSHGDADHFAGLPRILDSETEFQRRKRLFIEPRRVYHNGLAKGPSDLRDKELFGAFEEIGGRTYATDLVEDVRGLGDDRLNRPFQRWRDVLDEYTARANAAGRAITVERLERGSTGKFPSFAAEGVQVDVLAPMVETVAGQNGPTSALPFLRTPRKTASGATTFGSVSASHTINGHSIVLRLTYGRCRILFTGDLNEESEQVLLDAHAAGTDSLEADVLKVPHHGSADFLPGFLRGVGALVSIVSSGDESASKEYIHPRATLVGGLGRHSRVEQPLVFVTELVAFFAKEGYVGTDWHAMTAQGTTAVSRNADIVDLADRQRFYSFSRSAFGTVHLRTDGDHLLIWADSALDKLKEAYRFDLRVTPPRLEEVDPI
jgi:ribonuclease BN (tRNA processing enzyme)